MPGVVCGECGQRTNVRFRRGTRLADTPCPHCQKPQLKLPSAGQPSPNAGRTYEHCTICSRRGLHHKHPQFDWTPKYGGAGDRDEVFPAGSPCCPAHQPVPAARTADSLVIGALEERLGPLDTHLWPDDATERALAAVARAAPLRCPVCAAVGHSRPQACTEDSDFQTHTRKFLRGAALLGCCWDCGHTLELAALCPGGPYVQTVTEPAQGLLWDEPQWAVTARAVSPKTSAGEVDLYWDGPAHGPGSASDIPNVWYAGPLTSARAARFPSPQAARAALDSVFAPGSRWQLHRTGQVRIVPLYLPTGGPVVQGTNPVQAERGATLR